MDRNSILKIIGLLVLNILLYWKISIDANHYRFVAGKYGTLCYEKNNYNDNIKHPVFFKTLKDCNEFINN